MYNKIVILSKQ